MTDRKSPIGVFDSGIGGLTVVKEIINEMPSEDIVYFGDTARLPYGPKSRETIIEYCRQITRFLKSKDVKAIVIACNTATARALDTLQKENDIPVIGVIHAGALSAAEATRNNRIGIIATAGTVESEAYPNEIKKLSEDATVYQKACPDFVTLAEAGKWDTEETKHAAEEYLKEFDEKDVDALVLGCTHFPLLASTIGQRMGSKVTLVNPAYETAKELKKTLSEKNLLSDDKKAKYEFYVSGYSDNYQSFANSILGDIVSEIKKEAIDEQG